MKLGLIIGLLGWCIATKPLNILISVSLSTKSSINGILEISTELTKRGHHVHYASSHRYLKYAEGFNVTKHALPDVPDEINNDLLKVLAVRQEAGRGLKSYTFTPDELEVYYVDHQLIFKSISELIDSEHFDVIVCDFYTSGCRDAANHKKVPMIIGIQTTHAVGLYDVPYMSYDMEGGPNSMDKMTFLERVYDLTITQYTNYRVQKFQIDAINRSRKELGVKLDYKPLGPIEKNLVLSVSFFGFEPAVHLPPNMKVVGPIRPSIPQTLTDDLEEFLNTKNRVVYVGFGSISQLLPMDFQDILEGLKLLLKSGEIDGVVWGKGNSNFDDSMPDNIKLLPWAPQKAILKHPNVKLFVSHCGIESIFESIDGATPLMCLPFFFDQPKNAIKMEEIGIGKEYDRLHSTPTKFADLAKFILTDKEGTFHSNMLRIKAIADLQSSHGKQDGANLIEEVAYTAQICRPFQSPDDDLPCEVAHLIPASEKMGPIKAYNLDVYFFLWSISAITLFISFQLVRYIINRSVTIVKTKYD